MNGFTGVLSQLFVPTQSFAEKLDGYVATIQGKFPFNIAQQLQVPDGDGLDGGSLSAFPDAILWMPLDLAFLGTVASVVRPAIAVALFAWLAWWLIDRFTPQAVI